MTTGRRTRSGRKIVCWVVKSERSYYTNGDGCVATWGPRSWAKRFDTARAAFEVADKTGARVVAVVKREVCPGCRGKAKRAPVTRSGFLGESPGAVGQPTITVEPGGPLPAGEYRLAGSPCQCGAAKALEEVERALREELMRADTSDYAHGAKNAARVVLGVADTAKRRHGVTT